MGHVKIILVFISESTLCFYDSFFLLTFPNVFNLFRVSGVLAALPAPTQQIQPHFGICIIICNRQPIALFSSLTTTSRGI